MDTLELAHTIVDALDERKGEDILVLGIREISLLADYFVIASGTSPRMIKALIDAALEAVKQKHGIRARAEGDSRGGWILVDYGNVILHLFSPERRDYYRLEELYSDGDVVLHLQ
ncbi:MAG: ribosome silencing factor [Chloroflexota bacterium]|nr:ribosome silencing factor [Chloroflexota bacterium]